MRKLILFIACSLDGYIARTNGDVDWLFTDRDYGYSDFFAKIDTVLMGRRTYEQLLTFGEYPYQGTQGFVFSKTPKSKSDENVEFISNDVTNFIRNLKHENGKDIWLVGGAELIRSCMQEDSIDEFVISLHPIILGEGILLFRSPLATKGLTLQNSQVFDTGLVQLTYTNS
ncbi:MAG TPA: dihydrofolate reductase family protein [Leptolyngbyaceae cyanobacterium]